MEELLENQGLPVYLEIKNGLLSKATLAIDNFDINHEPRLIWRLVPRLSCEFSLINTIAKPALSAVGQKIVLQFDDFKIVVEVPDSGDGGTAKDLYAVLSDFHRKSAHFKNLDKDYNLQKSPTQQSSHYQQKVSLKEALFQATSKEETLLQLCTQLRFQEGLMIIDKIGVSVRERMVRSGMDQWIRFVKEKNDVKMRMDRGRWRLHASANQDIDLQAWYHALFYQEVLTLFLKTYIFNVTMLVNRCIDCVVTFGTKMRCFRSTNKVTI